MNVLTKDAKGFIEGVTRYIREERKDFSLLPKVEELFSKVSVQARKEKVAYVTTSIEITEEEKQTLEKILSRILGHRVTLEIKVNPRLLGGLKIQVGDWVVDTSLAGQLDDIGRALI